MKKCIRALGKIAIKFEKSVEKCMAILAKSVKQAKENPDHYDQIINEMLVVTLVLSRQCKIF